jgi:hypothetical protein
MNKKKKSKTNNKCSKNLDSSGSGNSQCYVLWNTPLALHGLQKMEFSFNLSDLYLLKNNFIVLILQRTYKYALNG